jgi:hypothetical protein
MNVIFINIANGEVYHVRVPADWDEKTAGDRIAEIFGIANYEWYVFDGLVRNLQIPR